MNKDDFYVLNWCDMCYGHKEIPTIVRGKRATMVCPVCEGTGIKPYKPLRKTPENKGLPEWAYCHDPFWD
jgi:hypothetical protein